jgi:(p)ppGpp synthase/HD superfamily hydrolase
MIFKALMFAKAVHRGQKRKFGDDPYVNHPIRVASRVMQLPYVTEEMIAIALLHDVVEDSDHTTEQIKALFGEAIAEGVKCLTRNKGGGSREAQMTALFEQMQWEADWTICTIKAIDRMDNLCDLMGYGDNPDAMKMLRRYLGESRRLVSVLEHKADITVVGELNCVIDRCNARMNEIDEKEARKQRLLRNAI